ncbi:MAG: DUF4347 domain-containing protein [Deltaproteobacteria bacterium]|nr:DUF4347 domain-containing protein [Deltaproteobacteria bacterium]
MAGLRLLVYDATCRGPRALYLSTIWTAGARLFSGLSAYDAFFGAKSWDEALEWLATVRADEPIEEVQYWGHGNFGSIRLGAQNLELASLDPSGPFRAGLDRVRDRIVGPEALIWLRTCEAFGTRRGQDFARGLADFFGCRVAGHTYVIGWAQSGLHVLRPGEEARWSEREGLHPHRPNRARWSGLLEPNTVPFLSARLPRWARR